MAISANVISMSLEEAVRSAVESGLKYAVEKCGCEDKALVCERLASNNEWACGYLAYGCAADLAAALAKIDDNVTEAYILGLAGEEDGVRGFPLVMVLSVTRRTAALDSILERIVSELPGQLAAATGLDAMRVLMDVQVVEDSDVSARRGLGAAIHSLWAPALKVWSRSI